MRVRGRAHTGLVREKAAGHAELHRLGDRQAERAAHEHNALHTEVEVAGLFRQDLAERTEQQRGAVGDGGDDEGDKQSHSLAASFSVFDERKMSR